jgi:hypothetical protein
MQARETQISAAQVSSIESRLAEVGSLKLGSFKVFVLELRMHEIHISKLALPTFFCL